MGWFDGLDEENKKATIVNLVTVMMADGKVDRAELRFLEAACQKNGISKQEFDSILANPSSVTYRIPSSQQERAEMLADAVFMMMSDGEIDKRELDVCVGIAQKMGINPQAVADIVNSVLTQIKAGNSRKSVSIEVEEFMRQT